jgi:serine/threonine-protein kinase
MAPEQATGGSRNADARADVFGLGAILRDLLAAENGKLVTPLAAIVARATAPAPADRYPDVDSLADDVRRWLDGERVAAHREGAVERATRVYRRNRPIILLLVAYVVVRVTILLWRGV